MVVETKRGAMLRHLLAWAERNPTAAGSLSMCCKYTLADLGTQLSTSSRPPASPRGGVAQCAGADSPAPAATSLATAPGVDLRRVGLFAGFGATYGAINHNVFRLINAMPWPGRSTAAVGMTAVDTLLHLPYLFMPLFYLAKEIAYADRLPEGVEDLKGYVAKSWVTRQQNFVKDQSIIITVWAPIDLVMFRYVPLHLRTSFLSLPGLAFPVILSHCRFAAEAS